MPHRDPKAKREYLRRYNEINREEINARRRESVKEKETKNYYQEHKDQINEKHQCQCGGKYTTHTKSAHQQTREHRHWIYFATTENPHILEI